AVQSPPLGGAGPHQYRSGSIQRPLTRRSYRGAVEAGQPERAAAPARHERSEEEGARQVPPEAPDVEHRIDPRGQELVLGPQTRPVETGLLVMDGVKSVVEQEKMEERAGEVARVVPARLLV